MLLTWVSLPGCGRNQSYGDADLAQKHGVTALHAAAMNGRLDNVKLLVASGADVTKRDQRKRTPFFLACESGDEETALFLAEQIAETNLDVFTQRSDVGKSPLRKAAARGHLNMVRILLDKVDSEGINQQDTRFGRTPLHAACSGGYHGVMELLFEKGSALDLWDKYGHTPLIDCYKNFAKSNSNDFEEVLLTLIEKDKAAAAGDAQLLNTAAMKGSMPLLTRLLEIGADPNVLDEHGWSSVQLAQQYGHKEAAELLSKRSNVVGRKPSAWVVTRECGELEASGTTMKFIEECEPASEDCDLLVEC